MRILIDPGTSTCTNMGDVAMLQVAVARLRGLWPEAELRVITSDAVQLVRHCPGVGDAPESGRRAWCDGVQLPAVVRARFPAAVRRLSLQLQGGVRHGLPGVYGVVLRSPAACRPSRRRALNTFLRMVHASDLLVVCGQATLADDDRTRALRMLDTADLAIRHRIPVVMVGQAVGPLTDPALIRRARYVLPQARLIAIREEGVALPLLTSLGVNPDRVAFTGDDAVELAWNERPGALGHALGVHLRVAPLAINDTALLQELASVIRASAQELGARLVPLPISQHGRAGANDPAVLQGVVQGLSDQADGGASSDTPLKVIAGAGTCRVVVTGAYHAAVFALSQGVPAICIGRSSYYLTKFRGLAQLFGPACVVVDLRTRDHEAGLAAAIRERWFAAEATREPLLAAALRQVRHSHAAYARVGRIVTQSRSGTAADAAEQRVERAPSPAAEAPL